MAFIHVIFAHRKIESRQHAGATNPQNDFLLETVFRVASVQGIRQASIHLGISRDIRVEKDYGYNPARRAFDAIKPWLDLDVTPLDRHQGFNRQQFEESFGVPLHRVFVLPAVGIDLLAEIALAVQQGDCHHRYFQVRGAFNGVSGKYSQTAAVSGNFGAQTDLHRKISNPRFPGETLPGVVFVHVLPLFPFPTSTVPNAGANV